MSGRVCILVPDPADDLYRSAWRDALGELSGRLAAAGIEVVTEPWTAHVEDASGLADLGLVLPLLAWGYHRDHARWLEATRVWAAAGVRIANPASVLGWNSDKSYLRRLGERGVAIPPTLWVEAPTEADVATAFDRFGADNIVVKPTVSGGAWRTQRLTRGEALTDPPAGAAMIQPFIPSIETEGETSLLFFDGVFSHAVNKRPVDGDFRVQVQFGGLYRAVNPAPEAMALARTVLAAVDEPLLYARIDMAPDGLGGWLLMEAELIEPDLYLAHDPAGGAGFIQAVQARLAA